MSFAERHIPDRDFYENLANIAGWRQQCANCNCPKWAHAFQSFAGPDKVAVGLCGCGKCGLYTPRRFEGIGSHE